MVAIRTGDHDSGLWIKPRAQEPEGNQRAPVEWLPEVCFVWYGITQAHRWHIQRSRLLDDSRVEFFIDLECQRETVPLALRLRARCSLHAPVIEQRETAIDAVSMRRNHHQRLRLHSRHAPSQFFHRGARGQRLLRSLFPQQRNNHAAVRSNTGKYEAAHLSPPEKCMS